MRLPDWRNSAVRRNYTLGWIAISLVWSVTRAVIIGHVFGTHGTSAYGYLIVDLVTTIPYAIYSAKAAFSWLDKSPMFAKYFAIASGCFIAPDVYVIATARYVSLVVWIGFGTFVLVMAVLAVKSAREK